MFSSSVKTPEVNYIDIFIFLNIFLMF